MAKKTTANSKISAVNNLVRTVKAHWNEPPEGRYLPYKEIISYAGGGIGVKLLPVTATTRGLTRSR